MVLKQALADARAICAAPAAPTGGAHWKQWGWGCGLCLIFQTITPAQAQYGKDVLVPSLQTVRLHEVVLDDNPGEIWARFRFVAPNIKEGVGAISYDVAAYDMEYLCNQVAVPWLATEGIKVARIVVSMSSQPVQLGDAVKDVTQFFEFYRPEADICLREEY